MNYRFCVGVFAALLPACVFAQNAPVRAELSLSSPLETARSGTPVVVELGYVNRTTSDVVVLDLVDPFLAITSWKWESASGSRYGVSVKDLHFSVLPESARPQDVVIHAGERHTSYASIPTPPQFGDEAWMLGLTVFDPFRKRTDTAQLRFKGSDDGPRCVVDRLGLTWAQAAVLELYPTRGVLRQLAEMNKLSIVEQCSKAGDRTADLILYTQAITQRRDIAPHWKALETAPEEIKCLRNYLLFYPLQYTAGVLTDEDADAIVSSVSPQSPLGTELIDRINHRRRF